MAYARLGDDSDVYVWSDAKQIWVMVSLALNTHLPHMPVGADEIKHHRAGQTLAFTDRSEAYAMLAAMCTEGVKVPGYVFTRLYDEMEELGNLVGVKRMSKYTTRVTGPF